MVINMTVQSNILKYISIAIIFSAIISNGLI